MEEAGAGACPVVAPGGLPLSLLKPSVSPSLRTPSSPTRPSVPPEATALTRTPKPLSKAPLSSAVFPWKFWVPVVRELASGWIPSTTWSRQPPPVAAPGAASTTGVPRESLAPRDPYSPWPWVEPLTISRRETEAPSTALDTRCAWAEGTFPRPSALIALGNMKGGTHPT